MKKTMTSMTYLRALTVADTGVLHTGPWTTGQGTSVSVAVRNRTVAPIAQATTALLPISDVVVFDGLAGSRSWSPPV